MTTTPRPVPLAHLSRTKDGELAQDVWRAERPAKVRRRRTAIGGRLKVALALMRMLKENGRWWLIPFVLVLLGAMLLLIGLQAIEYVAPFVYSIF